MGHGLRTTCAFLSATCLGGLCACHVEDPATLDAGPEPIEINKIPTGSIQIPSLCERSATDLRVTQTGADSFAMIWAEDHYQVVYTDRMSRDLYSVRLDAMGQPIAPPVAVESNPTAAAIPSLLSTPRGYIAAWQEVDPDDPKVPGSVHVHALDEEGQPTGTGRVIATGRSAQMRPVLADSPDGVAIAWMDQSGNDGESSVTVGDSVINLGLLDPGLALRSDIPPQVVTPNARAGYPWLAGSSDKLAMMWTSDVDGRADTFFSDVTGQLAMRQMTRIRDAEAVNAALLGRMIRTEFGYVAAWEDFRSGQEEIYMSLLDPSGRSNGVGLVEEPDTGNANWPHIAWTGTHFAIVYYQFRNGRPQVFLTFLEPSGHRVGDAADAQLSRTTNWARYPDIAWTGTEFGVMWVDSRTGQTELFFNRAACRIPAPL